MNIEKPYPGYGLSALDASEKPPNQFVSLWGMILTHGLLFIINYLLFIYLFLSKLKLYSKVFLRQEEKVENDGDLVKERRAPSH